MKFKVFPASAAYGSIKQSNADQRAHEYNDRQEGGVRNGILVYMFLMDLLIPICMFGFGKRFQSRPPRRSIPGGGLQDLHVHEK